MQLGISKVCQLNRLGRDFSFPSATPTENSAAPFLSSPAFQKLLVQPHSLFAVPTLLFISTPIRGYFLLQEMIDLGPSCRAHLVSQYEKLNLKTKIY